MTKSKKRPITFWWKTGLAASIAGGLAIWAGQLFFDPVATNQNVVAQSELPEENIVVPIEEKEEPDIKEDSGNSVDKTATIVTENRPVVKSSSGFSISNTPKEAVVAITNELDESTNVKTTANMTISSSSANNLNSESELEVGVVEPTEDAEEIKTGENNVPDPHLTNDADIEPLIPVSKESDWVLAANYGTMPPENNVSSLKSSFGDRLANTAESGWSPGSLNDPITPTFAYEPIEYGMPFITGITFSKATGKRGNIESGVQLIRVASKSSKYRYSYYYLGIPVIYRSKAIDKPKFDLYAFGGMTFEIGLKSTVKSITGEKLNVYSENPGFHTSLNFGVGNEFTLSKRTSLFVQPGLSLTVMNRLWGFYSIGDIRSIKRLWPSLSTGLRFNLD